MIQIRLDQKHFLPGDEISGAADWQQLESTESLDIRLIWYTAGKGDRDFKIVSFHTVENPANEGSEAFSFIAPDYPLSFSGKLISLVWAIEAIAFPSHAAETENIVIGPNRQEILIEDASDVSAG